MKSYEDYLKDPKIEGWYSLADQMLRDILVELERLNKYHLRLVDMLHEHTKRLDDIEDDVVLETIIDGKKNKNHRGPGYIYKKGVIEAIAYWIPCHCIVITAYNKNKSDKPHKDKKTHGSARKNGLSKVRQS